jgi:UDP-3-O-[3-hydroxymyristoyl] glucosamine N-acyltransferase
MRLSQLAQALGREFVGDDKEILSVATLAEAGPEDLSFLANPKYAAQLATTRAGAVVARPEMVTEGRSFVVSPEPYLDFARAVNFFARPQGWANGVSPLAQIDPTAQVDPTATLYPFVVVGPRSVIGPRSVLFPGVYVGEDCQVGADCRLAPHVSLMAGTILGDRVIIHAGAVLGSDGFGFAPSTAGVVKFPQIGRVVVEDDVEIGANTTIDRAALGETRIGAGTKIDNLVQLGHNVQVGKQCMLVAQVGIAGSTTLGNGVVLAGQVGVAGHIHLGDGCRIGAKSGVGQDVPPGTDMSGIPAMPHATFLRVSQIAPKLPQWRRRLSRLEKEVEALRQALDAQDTQQDPV